MNNDLVLYIRKYKDMINNECNDYIIEEMITDLKEILLKESSDICTNIKILETFYNIKCNGNIIDELSSLEESIPNTILTEEAVANMSKTLSTMKAGFGSKHDKITKRDKSWLNKNSKKILKLNYDEIELEVLSDYKVTFEQLINRHNIFDKIFVNSANDDSLPDKLRRFEDKNENLKNGLDNYFRTGTSRREIGLRKVSGPEAKLAVENMIAYCESFIAGKSFLIEKLNAIIVSINDVKVKEEYDPIKILKEAVDDKKDIEEEPEVEEDIEEEPEENVEEKPTEPNRGIQDRQVGIAVLLTVAEERYFDYINILKGLAE